MVNKICVISDQLLLRWAITIIQKQSGETPHNNNVATLLQPRKYYSNDSNLRYSNYKKPTPKMFFLLLLLIINYYFTFYLLQKICTLIDEMEARGFCFITCKCKD